MATTRQKKKHDTFDPYTYLMTNGMHGGPNYPLPRRYYVTFSEDVNGKVWANSLPELRKRVYHIIKSQPNYPRSRGYPFYNLIITSSRAISNTKSEKEDIGMFLITKDKDVFYEHWRRKENGKVRADGTIIKNKWYKE